MSRGTVRAPVDICFRKDRETGAACPGGRQIGSMRCVRSSAACLAVQEEKETGILDLVHFVVVALRFFSSRAFHSPLFRPTALSVT